MWLHVCAPACARAAVRVSVYVRLHVCVRMCARVHVRRCICVCVRVLWAGEWRDRAVWALRVGGRAAGRLRQYKQRRSNTRRRLFSSVTREHGPSADQPLAFAFALAFATAARRPISCISTSSLAPCMRCERRFCISFSNFASFLTRVRWC